MRLSLCLAIASLLLSRLPVCAAEADFTRDVRPILARHCFKCHGFDDKARKAKLRLDVRGGAVKKAIVPGKPDASELIRRICASDADEVMPPAATKNPLSDAQKQILKRWIEAGAEYKTHWAFVAPKQAALPKVKQTDWPRNAIDTFVLARLEAEGLRPSPRADRYTLMRRVYLDLIGLPPTPEEADAFVRDESPDAYERLVDRLLASPHYGERWARRWLDLARYADTNGYEKDRPRSIWPYRDWVIRALNADKPFDQFTIAQIAGDMLPGATVEQRVATGFHRNTMLNEEGGIDPLEFRFHAMTDRVNTTATAWLGLTLGCAQCHTHKYDPIPQREYYGIMAFLNNADEPEMDVPTPALAARRAEIEKQIATLEADLPNRFPAGPGSGKQTQDKRPEDSRRHEYLETKFHEWLKQESARAVRWQVLKPIEAKSNLPLLSVLDDASVLVSGDMSKRDVYDVSFRGDFKGVTALRLEVLPDGSLPKHGPGRVYYEGPFGDFFLSEVTLSADGQPVKFARASQSFGTSAAAAIDGSPLTGWSLGGGQGLAHQAIFTLSAPLGNVKALSLRLLFERYYAAGLGRFRLSATTDAHSIQAHEMPAEIEELLLVPEAKLTAGRRDQLLHFYLSVAPELATEREAIRKLRERMPAYPTTLVMKERPANNPRPTFRHHRGEFLQPEERVEPKRLSAIYPFPADQPRNRLTFARWLVDPRNPLVGRVTVNRQWAAFFGRGLVRTLADFGFTGEPPTHPELLDWLAVEFINRRWSLKTLHRLIVTSATYQQPARVTPELLARDAENKLLARGPRVRLEAELLRDAALTASGLLSHKIGGSSVFPPQPASVTAEGAYGSLGWKVSDGPDRHRRGLYTFSKRTAPFAMFTTFDAPSGEACVARREPSNTPLQALTLLNDAAFLECAQALGRLAASRDGSIEERAAWLFRRCLTRLPSDEERAALARFYRAQKARFERKELDATKIGGPGDGDANERAAWTATARALLNLDEFVMKD